MKIAEFLRCIELGTLLTIADYKSDKILIDKQTAHTRCGNIKKIFKQYLSNSITFLYAYDNKKIKMFIEE